MFATPTDYMLLTSSGFLLLNWSYFSIDSSEMISNFLAVLMNFTGYISYSIGSSVTNCRFSPMLLRIMQIAISSFKMRVEMHEI